MLYNVKKCDEYFVIFALTKLSFRAIVNYKGNIRDSEVRRFGFLETNCNHSADKHTHTLIRLQDFPFSCLWVVYLLLG